MSYRPIWTALTLCALALPAAAVDFDDADLAGDYALRFTRAVDYPASDLLDRSILGRVSFDGAGAVSSGRVVVHTLDWHGGSIDPATGVINDPYGSGRSADEVLRHESAVTGTYSVSPDGLVRVELVLAEAQPPVPAGGNAAYLKLNYASSTLVIEGVLSEEGSLLMAGIQREVERRDYLAETQAERVNWTYNDHLSGELRAQRRLPGRPLMRTRPDLP